MNREIKFRAWDSFNRIMYKENSKVIGSMYFYEGNEDVINQNIYMQFTGLHDKNGVPIYEGDVIEIEDRILLVKYNEKKATFISKFLKYKGNINPNFEGIENMDWAYYDVIGNIYENPELLK